MSFRSQFLTDSLGLVRKGNNWIFSKLRNMKCEKVRWSKKQRTNKKGNWRNLSCGNGAGRKVTPWWFLHLLFWACFLANIEQIVFFHSEWQLFPQFPRALYLGNLCLPFQLWVLSCNYTILLCHLPPITRIYPVEQSIHKLILKNDK